MLVNENQCFVDIRRRTGFNAWDIYLVEQSGRGRIAVAQPAKLIFIEQDEMEKIGEPTFTVSGAYDIERWFKATLNAIFEACPHLRKKYEAKANEDEIKALKEHIGNLNEIIKSLNPNMDIREKI